MSTNADMPIDIVDRVNKSSTKPPRNSLSGKCAGYLDGTTPHSTAARRILKILTQNLTIVTGQV
jgi:hypothetical protein